MVGEFGAICVLDWGIAVFLNESGDADGLIAGTPAYAAPEMADPSHHPLSPATDVFLLGATLHELVTGSPPNGGETTIEKLLASFAAAAHEYDSSVPPSLVALCRRAMAADPTERFGDASEVGAAVDEYRHHARSIDLCRSAARALGELEERLGRDETGPRVQNLFGETRFGFQQALRIWPDSGEATSGLQKAVELMIERELSRGAPAAASLLLADLPEPNPELAAQVEALLEADRLAAQRTVELEELAREHDLAQGARARAFVASAIGLIWTGLNIFLAWAWRADFYHLQHRLLFGLTVAFGIMVVGLTFALRGSLLKNLANERLTAGVWLAVAGQAALVASCWRFGLPMHQTMALLLDVYALISTAVTLAVDLRLASAVVGSTLGFIVAFIDPELVYEAHAGGNLLAMSLLVAFWVRSARRDARMRVDEDARTIL